MFFRCRSCGRINGVSAGLAACRADEREDEGAGREK